MHWIPQCYDQGQGLYTCHTRDLSERVLAGYTVTLCLHRLGLHQSCKLGHLGPIKQYFQACSSLLSISFSTRPSASS